MASMLFENSLKEEKSCAIKGETFANVEALAFSESDMDNKSETKVEEEESWDYTEVHGGCTFYYSITTTITSCYGKGKIDCTPGVEIGNPELIDIVCAD